MSLFNIALNQTSQVRSSLFVNIAEFNMRVILFFLRVTERTLTREKDLNSAYLIVE